MIFLTLINEYTDWSRAVEHPVSLYESLSDILGDALVVSPLVQSGDANVRAALDAAAAAAAPSTSSSYRKHHHANNGQQQKQQNMRSSPYSGVMPAPQSSPSAAQTSVQDTRTFFYVFSYNEPGSSSSISGGGGGSSISQNRIVSWRQGDELSYVFGAPLASDFSSRSFGHFPSNFSRQEAGLAEAVMTYWTNFVKFG